MTGWISFSNFGSIMPTPKVAVMLGNNSLNINLFTSKICLEISALSSLSYQQTNVSTKQLYSLGIFLETRFLFSKTIHFKSKPDWGNAAEEIFLCEVQAVHDLFVFLRVKITQQLGGMLVSYIAEYDIV